MLICDFAQTREGLLTVCSGGITRVLCAGVPAPLRVMVAALLEFGPDDLGPIHEVTWRVSHVDTAVTVTDGTGALQVSDAASEPGELIQVPLLIDLRLIGTPSFGQHDIKLSVDGAPELEVRSIWIVAPPAQ